MTSSAIDFAIFDRIQQEIDSDSNTRYELKIIIKDVEKDARSISAILSAVHSTDLGSCSYIDIFKSNECSPEKYTCNIFPL